MENLETQNPSRRKFLNISLIAGTLIGLIASFGQFILIILRFLHPKERSGDWAFVSTLKRFTAKKQSKVKKEDTQRLVAEVKDFKTKNSIQYKTPDGQSVVISRIGNSGTVKDFIALSSVCPHLGCKVFWESNTKSFFCPCHNGRFDSVGKPTEGPPAKANQELIRFPLKIENGLLYIKISTESLIRFSDLRRNHHKYCSENGEKTA